MKFDDIKKLHQRKYREQFGYFLLEGEHLVLELQKCLVQRTQALHFDAQAVSLFVTQERLAWAQQKLPSFAPELVSQKQMTQLSDTKTPQGVVACLPLLNQHVRTQNIQNEVCFYLHEVQDPGNLGSIIRSLAWFGKFRLLLSSNSVDPYNAKVLRASMGGIFHVPLERDVSLQSLQARFGKFAYLDLTGSSINKSDFAEYPCYLFGNEARGVPDEALENLNAQAYSISGKGNIESLNLATAASICAYRLSV